VRFRLPALLRGVAQVSRYRVEVSVLDSAGLELHRSDWTREVPATLAQAHGATIEESFGFEAAPGRYRVTVRLVPSLGEPVERTVVWRRTPPRRPCRPAAGEQRQAGGLRQRNAGPGEVRRAGLVMRTARRRG